MPLSELIQALEIAKKYGDPDSPTHCEHDELWLIIDPALVSKEDKKKLKGLGFFVSKEDKCFKSFRYGSA